jgi:hypothetical protein
MTSKLASICLGACALLSLSAHADPVTVSFTAIVSKTSADYAPLGSVITGSFVFDRDPSTYESFSIDETWLQRAYTWAPYGMNMQFAGPSSPDLSPHGGAVTVMDNYPYTYGSEPVDIVTLGTKRQGISYSLLLEAATSSFIGTALPTNEWLAGGWSSAYVNVFDEWSLTTTVVGQVTNLSVTPVPEPETMALLLVGLATMWGAKRRSSPTQKTSV